MTILGFSYLDNLKKFWRGQRYQGLGDTKRDYNKREMRVIKLGNKKKRVVLKMKQAPIKFHWKQISPLKLVASFHNGYVNTMIGLEGNKKVGGKKVTSGKTIPMVASSTNDVVDCRMVLKIYKNIVSSRELAHLLI